MQKKMKINIAVVKEIAKTEFNLVNNNDNDWYTRCFRSLFGCSPRILTAVFNTLLDQELISISDKVQHLMWALAFLKSYNAETYFAARYSVSEKTIRKWIWYFLDRLSKLEVVSVTSYIYYCFANVSNLMESWARLNGRIGL